MKRIVIASKTELDKAARQLLAYFPEKGIVCFEGQMGMGKTTLINTLCKVLGVKDHTASPTFSIVNEYHREKGVPIYHFDLYRLNSPEELYDLGFEDYLCQDALIFIEWPEIAAIFLPDDVYHLKLSLGENDQRIIEFQ